MTRRDTGRDRWLTLRMILVCLVLGLAYAALAIGRVVLAVEKRLARLTLMARELESPLGT